MKPGTHYFAQLTKEQKRNYMEECQRQGTDFHFMMSTESPSLGVFIAMSFYLDKTLKGTEYWYTVAFNTKRHYKFQLRVRNENWVVETYAISVPNAMKDLHAQLNDIGVTKFQLIKITEPSNRVMIAHEDIILN